MSSEFLLCSVFYWSVPEPKEGREEEGEMNSWRESNAVLSTLVPEDTADGAVDPADLV